MTRLQSVERVSGRGPSLDTIALWINEHLDQHGVRAAVDGAYASATAVDASEKAEFGKRITVYMARTKVFHHDSHKKRATDFRTGAVSTAVTNDFVLQWVSAFASDLGVSMRLEGYTKWLAALRQRRRRAVLQQSNLVKVEALLDMHVKAAIESHCSEQEMLLADFAADAITEKARHLGLIKT